MANSSHLWPRHRVRGNACSTEVDDLVSDLISPSPVVIPNGTVAALALAGVGEASSVK
jgi:hypothetical protein